MTNPFDQFDAPQANPFDQFDAPVDQPAIEQPSQSLAAPSSPRIRDQIMQTISGFKKMPSVLRDPVRATLQGPTLGFSDEIGSGVAALAAKGAQKVGLIPDTGESVGDIYSGMQSQVSGEQKEYAKENPMTALGLELAGAVPLAVATGGASMPSLASKAPAVANVLSKAQAIAPTTYNALRGAAMAAPVGAAYGAGTAEQGERMEGAKKGGTVAAIAGGGIPVLGAGISRAVSTKASQNPQLQSLLAQDVKPTVGQAMGGMVNRAEQKAISIPFVGEMIAGKRGAAKDQALKAFNNRTINETLAPIGQKVKGHGQEAVSEAAKKASNAYESALSKIKGVQLDDVFMSNLDELKGMAKGLSGGYARKFERLIDDEVVSRLSPNRAMIPEAYKKLDSVLGKKGATFAKSTNASEKEFGDAVLQLQNLLKEQMFRSNPKVAGELKSADTAYAMLTKIEAAAAKAADKDGIFTPKQLMQAVKTGDQSIRKRNIAHGEGLLQKTAKTGIDEAAFLADSVANSGTVDRAAQIGTGGALFAEPVTAASMLGSGVTLYSQPVQNMLVNAIAKRPEGAQALAKKITQASANRLSAPAAVAANRMAAE